MRARRSENGFVFLVVLFGLMLLAALASEFSFIVRVHLGASRNISDLARTEAAADAGISLGILRLSEDRAHSGPIASLSCSMPGEIGLDVRFEDEAGKIDLNFGDERLLKALLIGAGASVAEADRHVDRIVDFRDVDDLRRPMGAEQADYIEAGLPFGPKNAQFSSIDEIEQVLGLAQSLILRIRPHLTVQGGVQGFDPGVASGPMLASLSQGLTVMGLSPGPDPAIAMASLPGELRRRSSRTAFTVRAVAQSKAGTMFARKAIVIINREQGFRHRYVVWSRDRLPEDYSEFAQQEYAPCL